MKIILPLLVFSLVFLSACSPPPPASAVTGLPSLIPTRPSDTPTPAPTGTDRPTNTPTPDPTNTTTPTHIPTIQEEDTPTSGPTPACAAYFNPLGFTDDGQTLLGTVMVDPQPGFWIQALDVQDLTVRTLAKLDERYTAVALAPDRQSLAWARPDFSIERVSVADGSLLAKYTGHTDWVNALLFSPDGSRLYSAANDETVIEWDPSGKKLRSFRPMGVDFPADVLGLGISPDGKTLITIPFEGTAKAYETGGFTQTGEYAGAINGAYSGSTAIFSPDGKYLSINLMAGPGATDVWQLDDGKKVWSGGFMGSPDFSPNGTMFAHSEAGPDNQSLVILRTADAQTILRTIDPMGDYGMTSLMFSPDSKTLVTGGHNQEGLWRLGFWNVSDGRLLNRYFAACP